MAKPRGDVRVHDEHYDSSVSPLLLTGWSSVVMVKGTSPRLTSSSAMLVFRRLLVSTSILGTEPRKSCLALKAATTIKRYLESTPGHSSSFEMWLNPLCVD
jgi:hypothetical protein